MKTPGDACLPTARNSVALLALRVEHPWGFNSVSEGGLELRYLDITSSTVSSRLAWSEYVFGPTQCRLMLSDSR